MQHRVMNVHRYTFISLFSKKLPPTLISGMAMIFKLPRQRVDTDLETHVQIPLQTFGKLAFLIQLIMNHHYSTL